MAITKNVPPSGSVVSEQIESFLVFHGCVSTIPLSIGPLAKLNYLAAQGLVDTSTPKTEKRNFVKQNLFPLLLLKTEMKKMISLTTDWYFPGMEINFTWFDDKDVLEPPPSYERIFFCNQENDQILEFEINRAEANHLIRKNSPVEESEFDGYP